MLDTADHLSEGGSVMTQASVGRPLVYATLPAPSTRRCSAEEGKKEIMEREN